MGICQLVMEKGVGSGPSHYELCPLLLLTQTLPSILREGQRAYLSATSKVLQDTGVALSGLLLEFQATRCLLLQLHSEPCVWP